MKNKTPINLLEIFSKVLGDEIKNFTLPPPSFEVMECEAIDFNEEEKTFIMKLPVLEKWQNPYGTMQGGMIDAAIDNAAGPLSMLICPPSMTRTIETKLMKAITMDIGYIYVCATLTEEKRRRLTFDVKVMDENEEVYATSKVVNFLIDKN